MTHKLAQVLVTAANGDIGESIGRLLKSAYPKCRIDGGDMVGAWPGAATFDRMTGLPRGDDASYLDALRTLQAAERYDAIIPVSEPEIYAATEAGDAAADLPLILPAGPKATLFMDKLKTAQWLSEQGLIAPRTVPLPELSAEQLPVFIKPRRGWGNRNFRIVRRRDELAALSFAQSEDYVAQQLLEPATEEYTCALVRLDGETRSLVMRRVLEGGTTIKVTVADIPVITELLHKLAEAMDLNGAMNVQLRLTDQGPMIFEINPRFSGTVLMRHTIGFSDLLWVLEHKLSGAPPTAIPDIAAGTTVYRLARELAISPDGQILSDEGV